MPSRQLFLIASALVSVLLGWGSSAQAGVFGVTGYTASAGTVDRLFDLGPAMASYGYFHSIQIPASSVVVSPCSDEDDAGFPPPDPGTTWMVCGHPCWEWSPTCDAIPYTQSQTVRLGDLDDSYVDLPGTESYYGFDCVGHVASLCPLKIDVYGEEGNDVLRSEGEAREESLSGGPGNDYIDFFVSTESLAAISGGEGDDEIWLSDSNAPDQHFALSVSCGPGTDVVRAIATNLNLGPPTISPDCEHINPSTPPPTQAQPGGRGSQREVEAAHHSTGPRDGPSEGLIKRACESPAADPLLLSGSLGTGLVSVLSSETAAGFSAAAGYGGAVVGVLGIGCSIAVDRPNSDPYLKSACYALGESSVALGVGAVVAAPSFLPALGLGLASYLTGFTGAMACLADPPDRSFRTVPVAKPHLVSVKSSKGMSRRKAALVQKVLDNVAELQAFGSTMATCINRASGAEQSHRSGWADAQHRCAAANARAVAEVIRAQVPLLHALAGSARKDGLKGHAVTKGEMTSSVEDPRPGVRGSLRSAGVTPDQLHFVKQEVHLLSLRRSPKALLKEIGGSATLKMIKATAARMERIAAVQLEAVTDRGP